MLLISYDISDTKLRTKFMKFILRFGNRIQYSVYEIDNSPRILNNIRSEIDNVFMPQFGESDSIIILPISNPKDIIRMGYARHDDETIILI